MATIRHAEVPRLKSGEITQCDKISLMSSIAMDAHISLKSRLMIRIHTMRCKSCRSAADHFQVIRNAAQRFERERPPLDTEILSRTAAERMNGQILSALRASQRGS